MADQPNDPPGTTTSPAASSTVPPGPAGDGAAPIAEATAAPAAPDAPAYDRPPRGSGGMRIDGVGTVGAPRGSIALDPLGLTTGFSPSAETVLSRAAWLAAELRLTEVHVEQLLLALYSRRDGPARAALERAGYTPGRLLDTYRANGFAVPDDIVRERVTGRLGKGAGARTLADVEDFDIPSLPLAPFPTLSPHAERALANARAAAAADPFPRRGDDGRPLVQTRHLLRGVFDVGECHVVRVFEGARPHVEQVLAEVALNAAGAGAPRADPTPPPESGAPTPLVGTWRGADNDRPDGEDRLGFTQYVEAFANLVESPDTAPPLTIGIFGSWGAGKSWLVNRLVATLRERAVDPARLAMRPRPARVHCVMFNAWEYNAAPHIWPRLVRLVMNRVDADERPRFLGLSWLRAAWRKLHRNLTRLVRREWPALAAWLLAGAGLGWVVWMLVQGRLAQGEAASRSLLGVELADGKFVVPAALAALAGAVKVLRETVFAPLGGWVTALLADDERRYGATADYVRHMRQDLELLDDRLTKTGSRVLIAIDDLDRCEPEKAIEVLQAINLLLDRRSFIVCLGIDARVVTAAVERHYRELLGPAGITGYEYLDKIVQIPFRIPEPTPDELRDFLELQLTARDRRGAAGTDARRRSGAAAAEQAPPAGRSTTGPSLDGRRPAGAAPAAGARSGTAQPSGGTARAAASTPLNPLARPSSGDGFLPGLPARRDPSLLDDATRGQLLDAAEAIPVVGPFVQLYNERRRAKRFEAARPAAGGPFTGLAGAPAATPPRPTPPPPRHFSDAEREAFRAVAPYLRPNPRHIKRVVNVYALVRALADGRGETRILADPEATVRWLALCAQWPYAAREMLRRLDAIDAEQARARESGREARDPAAPPLAHLLSLIEPALDRSRRARFDHEPAVLARLAATSGGIAWDEVRVLRRYTLNFNPALESELRGAASRSSMEG